VSSADTGTDRLSSSRRSIRREIQSQRATSAAWRRSALAVDAKPVPSATRLGEALAARWPRLAGRVDRVIEDLAGARVEASDLVVSVHACGALSDVVIGKAIAPRAPVAVLPCCHDARSCDPGGLLGFLPLPLAVDATRVARLRAEGYDVLTQTIPEEITPHNRLIVAWPAFSHSPG
jgi:hypothetical protein